MIREEVPGRRSESIRVATDPSESRGDAATATILRPRARARDRGRGGAHWARACGIIQVTSQYLGFPWRQSIRVREREREERREREREGEREREKERVGEGEGEGDREREREGEREREHPREPSLAQGWQGRWR